MPIQTAIIRKPKVIKHDDIDTPYSIHYILKDNLVSLMNNVRNDYDAFIIVSGKEGFGKSTLAIQCAYAVDPSFDLDRVCFTADQFFEAVDTAEKYQAIVFDETMGYLSARGAMSKFNRALIKVMSEMRSKNLVIFLCIPNFFELDRYPAIHRSTALLHVYRRGACGSYAFGRKKLLYIKGKKTYGYSLPPEYVASFTKYFPIDKQEYEKKKQASIREWYTEKSPRKSSKSDEDEPVSY